MHSGTGVSPAERRQGEDGSAAGVTNASSGTDGVSQTRDPARRRHRPDPTHPGPDQGALGAAAQPRPQGPQGQVQGLDPRLRLVAGQPAAAARRLLRRLPAHPAGPASPSFAIYLMSGLLIWNAFSGSVTGACGSVVGNAQPGEEGALPAAGAAAVGGRLRRGALRAAAAACWSSWSLVLRSPVLRPAAAAAVPGDRGRRCCSRSALSMLVAGAERPLPRHPAPARGRRCWPGSGSTRSSTASGLIRDQLGTAGTGLYWLNPMANVIATMQRAIYKHAVRGTDGVKTAGARRPRLRLLPGAPRHLARHRRWCCSWIGRRRLPPALPADFAEEL